MDTPSLAYVTRLGWNLPGNLIAGEEAFRLYLANTHAPPDLVEAGQRRNRYPVLANDVLRSGAPGSSAGGEQPKFLVARTPGPAAVLVKFSPPTTTPASRRVADLLIAEHVAHKTLHAHGHPSARSGILFIGERVFLEVERFDRLPGAGRRGLLSLFALDAQFVGRLRGWSETANELASQGRITGDMLAQIAWRELFGHLIANTDMHAGNLSFFMRGERIMGLAPAYDMSPMAYAPAQGQIHEHQFELALPTAGHAPLWPAARQAAAEFWTEVVSHPKVSRNFRGIAAANAKIVQGGRNLEPRLPRPA